MQGDTTEQMWAPITQNTKAGHRLWIPGLYYFILWVAFILSGLRGQLPPELDIVANIKTNINIFISHWLQRAVPLIFDVYKLWFSWLCYFPHFPVASSFLHLNIFLSILFSYTTDRVFFPQDDRHQHKTEDKIFKPEFCLKCVLRLVLFMCFYQAWPVFFHLHLEWYM
jgi:hypothetical protein